MDSAKSVYVTLSARQREFHKKLEELKEAYCSNVKLQSTFHDILLCQLAATKVELQKLKSEISDKKANKRKSVEDIAVKLAETKRVSLLQVDQIAQITSDLNSAREKIEELSGVEKNAKLSQDQLRKATAKIAALKESKELLEAELKKGREELKDTKESLMKEKSANLSLNDIYKERINELALAKRLNIEQHEELKVKEEIIDRQRQQILDMERFILDYDIERCLSANESSINLNDSGSGETIGDDVIDIYQPSEELSNVRSSTALAPIPEENPDSIPDYNEVWYEFSFLS